MAKYAPVPESAVLSLGGFTWYHPEEWDRYLSTIIRKHHPLYFLRHVFPRHGSASKEANGCVLDSVRKYLLSEFGILLPRDTIFKVFNEREEGLLPAQMVAAISAVVEPLGLEIERILVTNDTLRRGLNCPGKTVDISGGEEFDGRPGVCMINIEQGFSHAFFWKRMDARKFSDEQFRLALTLRRIGHAQPSHSALRSLAAYRLMVSQRLADELCQPGSEAGRLYAELDALSAYAQDLQASDTDEFRQSFDQRISALLADLSRLLRPAADPAVRSLLASGEMVRSIFREVEAIF